MANINPPKTLKERYGTLERYFEATANDHNGLVYKDFLWRINPSRKHKPSAASSAEDFNVSTRTWHKWKNWHREEQGAIDPDSAD